MSDVIGLISTVMAMITCIIHGMIIVSNDCAIQMVHLNQLQVCQIHDTQFLLVSQSYSFVFCIILIHKIHVFIFYYFHIMHVHSLKMAGLGLAKTCRKCLNENTYHLVYVQCTFHGTDLI